MTRKDIDTVRTNAVLLSTIAEKISALERIIEARGINFKREKELADLKATYELIDSDERRNQLKNLIIQSKLTPMQKTIFYEYYINGKTAKAVGADCCLCDREIYNRLREARHSLGLYGSCRKNNL